MSYCRVGAYYIIYLSDGVNQFVLVELLMSIRIVQALHVDGHAALPQRRPTSGEPRWTRRRVRQVRTYRSRGGRRRCGRRLHRFSLVACYPLRITRAVRSRSGGSRLLRITRVLIVCGYRRGGALVRIAYRCGGGGSRGGRRSLWRRRLIRVHWHCRMSTAKWKKKKLIRRSLLLLLLLYWTSVYFSYLLECTAETWFYFNSKH